MHIKEKMLNRIVTMFLCILLLSNFGLSITLAAKDLATFSLANATNGTMKISTAEPRSAPIIKTIATLNLENNGHKKDIDITVRETDLYEIVVSGTKVGDKTAEELLYELCTGGKYVALAATKSNNGYKILTQDTSTDKTTINVILEAGKNYTLTINSSVEKDSEITITMTKRTTVTKGLAVTNIPATVISNNEKDYKSQPLAENGISKYPYVEFSDAKIEEYIEYGVSPEDNVEKGGALEAILVNLILGFSTVLVTIIELLMNANVRLTIDNIIFNKFDQTVIDLTPLGGIQVGSGTIASGKGIFYDENVGTIIKVLFDALKNLAIVIYIVMLLYIGVKILLSVGGKNQKKYLKYLEYWITGLFLLVLLPYFLPAIPAISNSLVELMEENAASINGDYSTTEVLRRLGNDASLLGEDAEVVELQNAIDEKVNRLSEMIDDAPKTRADAQASIDAKIEDMLAQFGGLNEEQRTMLQSRILQVIEHVDDNFDNWTPEVQTQYEEKVANVREYIFDAYFDTNDLRTRIISKIPVLGNRFGTSIRPEMDFEILRAVDNVIREIKRTSESFGNSNYKSAILELRKLLVTRGYTQGQCNMCINEINIIRFEYMKLEKFDNLEALFEDYKNAVIQEEIEVLRDMRKNISRDVMTTLKSKAKEEQRVIYAIAWVILLYQMFAILFMYYKRVFVIIVLIIIFPLIMAFYVFDKIGDGEAQSLQTWLKEFLANILIQVLHAAIYIILINIGIDACNADPTRNWFFLVLAVCFLFPGETMLRGLLGLNASTLRNLKTNVAATVAGTMAIAKTTKNTYRGVRGYIKDGGVKSTINKLQKEYKEEEERKANKRKRRSDLEVSKRRAKMATYRNEEIADRKARISVGAGNTWDKIRDKASDARDKISGFKLVRGGKYVASAFRKTRDAISSNKVVRGLSKAASVGKVALRRGGSLAKKGVGITAGLVEGAENFGEAGAMSSLSVARATAHGVGGFKDRNKKIISKRREQQINEVSKQVSTAKTKYKKPTLYNNGEKVSGSEKNITPGNVNGTTSTVRTTVTTTTTTNNNGGTNVT